MIVYIVIKGVSLGMFREDAEKGRRGWTQRIVRPRVHRCHQHRLDLDLTAIVRHAAMLGHLFDIDNSPSNGTRLPSWSLLNHNLPTRLHRQIERCNRCGDEDRGGWIGREGVRRRTERGDLVRRYFVGRVSVRCDTVECSSVRYLARMIVDVRVIERAAHRSAPATNKWIRFSVKRDPMAVSHTIVFSTPMLASSILVSRAPC